MRRAAAGSDRRPLAPRVPVAPLALAIAVIAPVAIEGGFSPTSRSLFIGLALCAFALVYALDERPLEGITSSVPVLALFGLAALSIASGFWALGEAGGAERAGFVIASLAGVALVAGWVVRAHGIAWVAGLIAAVAAVEAAIGLTALALQHEPWAQMIGGAWRPGGTFEYPPALAVLQVSALPIFAWMILKGGTALRLAGAVGGILAVAVLATAESRLGLGLCLLLFLAAAVASWHSRSTVESERATAFAGPPIRVLVGLAATALLLSVAVVALRGGGEASEPVSGIDHGRAGEWSVAFDAMAERPLVGAGADSYALAASEVGGGKTLFAHNLPLEIWAELGPVGLALVIVLFASTAALVWRLRSDRRAWLLAPAVLAFPLANLVDWTWHLAGAAALWAAALGALLAIDAERREAQSISAASA